MRSTYPHIQPDLQAARDFLLAMDKTTSAWTFQTFDDVKNPVQGRLNKTFHGSFDKHADVLADLNAKGAGVFFVPNETDGAGRKKSNIVQIRALFVDLDGAPLAPLEQCETPPHLVVETSPYRYHCYWRVRNCAVDDCEPALKELIQRFDADRACSDRSRLLRLPGFVHRKASPFVTRLIENRTGFNLLEDLELDLHKRQKNQKNLKNQMNPKIQMIPRSVRDDAADAALQLLVSKHLPKTEGQRNRSLFNLARDYKAMHPDASRADKKHLVGMWHELAMPIIGTKDISISIGDFCRGWEAVHSPSGETLSAIVESINQEDEMPASLVGLGLSNRDIKLARLCKALHEHWHPEPFPLGCRQVASILNEHYTDSACRLRNLVDERVLELVAKGTRGQNGRYRYLWHE